MTLTFLGAAGNVTGSRFLLEHNNKKILIDCGLFQERNFQSRNWDEFPVPPSSIDAVLLTHAHIDHCGYLPKLVKEGFSGKIYCTEPTRHIVEVSLLDTARLQENDAEFKRRRHKKEKRKSKYPVKPLYKLEDAREVMPLLEVISYRDVFSVIPEVTAEYFEAGHILGAAMIRLKVKDNGEEKIVIFSGDIGRWDRPIIEDPHVFDEADIVVMEATYGNRNHEDAESSISKLERVINETVERGGNVVIPTFAIERAQELLYDLNELHKEKRIPDIMTFLDSPMAIAITKVFEKLALYFDADAKERLKDDDSIFRFPTLQMTRTTHQSKSINNIRGSSIILAGSGMCTGGRVKHHLVANISRPESTILFVGYQAHGTLGRYILERPKSVRIIGKSWDVKARIEKVNGLSAHADQSELLKWVKGFKTKPKKLFIVHAEPKAAETFAEILKKDLNIKAHVAEYREEVEI